MAADTSQKKIAIGSLLLAGCLLLSVAILSKSYNEPEKNGGSGSIANGAQENNGSGSMAESDASGTITGEARDNGGSGSMAEERCGTSPDPDVHYEVQHESHPFISNSGNKVTTEVTAKTIAGAEAEHSCHVEWILHVWPAGDKARNVVVSSGEDGGDEDNDFRTIAWSADGDRLLSVMASVQGDYESTTPVVYSIREQKTQVIDLAKLFEKQTIRSCSLFFDYRGFAPDGRIAFDVRSDEDLNAGETPCVQQGRWLVGSDGNHLEPMLPTTT